MNPLWWSLVIVVVIAAVVLVLVGVGLVVGLARIWRFWKSRSWKGRPSRRRPEIAYEVERWLQVQQGGSGNPDWRDP